MSNTDKQHTREPNHTDTAPDPCDPAYWTPAQRAEAETYVSSARRFGPDGLCYSSECHCARCSE
jgi:hypothetical protein